MKCGATVYRRTTPKGRKVIVAKLSAWGREVLGNDADSLPYLKGKYQDVEECDGDIVAIPTTDVEGECPCCSYAVVEIEYKCSKCGNTDFPELPSSEEEISKILTNFAAAMNERERRAKFGVLSDRWEKNRKLSEEAERKRKRKKK